MITNSPFPKTLVVYRSTTYEIKVDGNIYNLESIF